MVMNKVKEGSNMYGWINKTWNPIRGECPHKCQYCYMKRFKVGKLRLDEKSLKDNLGEGNTIFVGSSCDMFAKNIPDDWIERVLLHCQIYDKNTYLFQSKNPDRFLYFDRVNLYNFPRKVILGTTIESDRVYFLDKKKPLAPEPHLRVKAMEKINWCDKMVSLEPIIDFSVDCLVEYIKRINPKFVSIGADSQNSNLPEPSPEKIQELIKELKKFTEVKIKPNLKRIVKVE